MTTPDHDALYHSFFSDPKVVAQLLRGFVEAQVLEGLDLDAMEQVNTNLLAENGARRASDLIWRIPRRDGRGAGETYVILLLEFQSTSDRWMALRLLVYAGLIWQQLIREQRLPPDGKLAPILPIALYNGESRWRAPLDLRELIGLPDESPLWQWQPGMRYHLIDEGAFGTADLERREGLPALLFRLENASDPRDLVGLTDAALAWFAGHPGFETARKLLVALLGTTMARFRPDMRVPEELLEVRNMLATRVEQWKQEWRQEGRHEGRQEGEQALLLRLLERRFGALPDWARDRVLGADTMRLEEWSLRLLDVTRLEEVLS